MKLTPQDELRIAWEQLVEDLLRPIVPYLEKLLLWIREVIK